MDAACDKQTVLNGPHVVARLIGDKTLVSGLGDGDGGSAWNPLCQISCPCGQKHQLLALQQVVGKLLTAGHSCHTGQIHASVQNQILHAAGALFQNFDVHMGVFLKKRRESQGQKLHPPLDRNAEPDFSVLLRPYFLDFPFQILLDGEDLLGGLHVFFPGRSERDRICGAVKDRGSQVCLGQLHHLAQGGLGDKKLLRRCGDAALLQYGHNVLCVLQIHESLL